MWILPFFIIFSVLSFLRCMFGLEICDSRVLWRVENVFGSLVGVFHFTIVLLIFSKPAWQLLKEVSIIYGLHSMITTLNTLIRTRSQLQQMSKVVMRMKPKSIHTFKDDRVASNESATATRNSHSFCKRLKSYIVQSEHNIDHNEWRNNTTGIIYTRQCSVHLGQWVSLFSDEDLALVHPLMWQTYYVTITNFLFCNKIINYDYIKVIPHELECKFIIGSKLCAQLIDIVLTFFIRLFSQHRYFITHIFGTNSVYADDADAAAYSILRQSVNLRHVFP